MAELRRMELMMLRVLMGSGMEKTRSLFSRTGELPYPRRRVMKTKSLSNRSDPLDVLIFPLQRDATRSVFVRRDQRMRDAQPPRGALSPST
jgi:hypothetical protein